MADERPPEVPEKFWDAENGTIKTQDLLKSYSHMESQYSQLKNTPAPAAPALPEWDAFANTVTSSFADGALAPDARSKLVGAGMPEKYVDGYVDLVKNYAEAAQELHSIKIAAKVGGKEKLDELLAWAGDNLDDTEIARFNTNLANPESYDMALDALIQRSGSRPASAPAAADDDTSPGADGLIQGSRSSSGGGIRPFADQREMVAAMSVADERGRNKYRTDPAYRAEVKERVRISTGV